MDVIRPCTMLNPDKIAVHAGSPCDDPACLFRRPIERPFQHEDRRVSAEMQKGAAELRRALGLPSSAKAEYVRAEAAKPAERAHYCHLPPCKEPVPPVHLMCKPHWKLVPRALQRAVWKAFQEGQEKGLIEPSQEYVAAAHDAIQAALERLRPKDEPKAEAPDSPQLGLFK